MFKVIYFQYIGKTIAKKPKPDKDDAAAMYFQHRRNL